MSLDNQKYIDGLRQNNAAVIRKIYENYALKVKRLIIKKGGIEADAKDIFQDALAIIFQKIQKDELTLTSSFQNYLISVCKFLYANKRRKNSRITVTNDLFTTYLDTIDLEKEILAQEEYNIYKDNFFKLRRACQTILKLAFDNHSMSVISQKLHLKNAHIARSRKYRCQKKLEELIKADQRYKDLSK